MKARRVAAGEWAGGNVGPVLGVDFETFYSASYSVSQMGNWAYVHDERFDAWAVSVSDGERTCVCRPAEFPWATVSGRELVAHNADFDEAVFLRLQEQGVIATAVSPLRWHCSAALCAFLQLPRDLAGAVLAVFGRDLDKSVRDRRKGKTVGKGQFAVGSGGALGDRALPDVDQQLGLGLEVGAMTREEADYAATDAEMAMALWRELSQYWPEHERRLCELTRAMGRTGLCVDWEYVESKQAELKAIVAEVSKELPWHPALSIKKFQSACAAAGIPTPKSTAGTDGGFQDWAREHASSEAAGWAGKMQRIRSANRTMRVLEAMRIRRIALKEDRRLKTEDRRPQKEPGWSLAFSGAGGPASIECAELRRGDSESAKSAGRSPAGDRMAYELKYFGATTGRWSGGGGLNMQNYNRKPAEGVDLRRCIRAPEGHVLAVVDYSQIESRVLLYLAGDIETLEMFRANPDADAYEIHARATMGWTPEARPETADRRLQTAPLGLRCETLKEFCERTGSGIRQLAKARVLGLGFGCGARRFVEVAKVMAGLDVSEEESKRIVSEFRDSNPEIVRLWQRLEDACEACDGSDYRLPLPCTQANPALNRFLIYRDVQVDPPSRKATVGRCDGIACTVAGDRIRVYGGLLAENWTQATARDVLASAWLRCDSAGFRPVLSVHDELVFEVPEASAEKDLRRIVGIMEEPVSWATGLPLRADGKLCAVYGK